MNKVWVNGAFDILHVGHLKLLEKAKSYGHVRVGIDSDSRIKQMKGSNRPFNTAYDRVYALKSLKYVDEVVIFNDSEELAAMIEDYEPEYMVIGSDYVGKSIIGVEYVNYVVFFDRITKYSTTAILEHEKNTSNR